MQCDWKYCRVLRPDLEFLLEAMDPSQLLRFVPGKLGAEQGTMATSIEAIEGTPC